MCPVCWGTAIASFGAILAASVMSIAGNDRITLVIAAGLALAWLLDQSETLAAPLWLVGMLVTAIIVRVLYLVLTSWNQLLICRAWNTARQLASRSCRKI